MNFFDPKNNYWLVTASGSGIYSSATNTYVPANNVDYVNWQAKGLETRRIASEAELWESLAQLVPGYLPDWLFNGTTFSQPGVGVYTAVQLAAYAAMKRYNKEVGGTTIGGVPVLTDDRSKMLIIGACVAASADPTWTTVWQGADGNAYPLNATQMVAVGNGVQAFVSLCFGIYATTKAAIEAGTITALAQIDAAFA